MKDKTRHLQGVVILWLTRRYHSVFSSSQSDPINITFLAPLLCSLLGPKNQGRSILNTKQALKLVWLYSESVLVSKPECCIILISAPMSLLVFLTCTHRKASKIPTHKILQSWPIYQDISNGTFMYTHTYLYIVYSM